MTGGRVVTLLAVLASAACGDEAATPTSPSSTTASATMVELFNGTLAVRGTRFYSYTVRNTGTVTAMFASLSPRRLGAPARHRLEFGIGIPAGTGCAVRMLVYAAPDLVPQLSEPASPGVHCVRIADVDGLPSPMEFSVRITHP